MRYNHFDMLPEKAFQPIGKRMTLEGCCSAPAGPTNTTVTNTNIPDYAQPYVENMLIVIIRKIMLLDFLQCNNKHNQVLLI